LPIVFKPADGLTQNKSWCIASRCPQRSCY